MQWFCYVHKVGQPLPLSPEYFHQPPKDSAPINSLPSLLLPQPLTTMNVLFVSIDLQILLLDFSTLPSSVFSPTYLSSPGSLF